MNEESSRLAVRYLQRVDERMILLEARMDDLAARLERVTDLCDTMSSRLERLGKQLLKIDRQLRAPD